MVLAKERVAGSVEEGDYMDRWTVGMGGLDLRKRRKEQVFGDGFPF